MIEAQMGSWVGSERKKVGKCKKIRKSNISLNYVELNYEYIKYDAYSLGIAFSNIHSSTET